MPQTEGAPGAAAGPGGPPPKRRVVRRLALGLLVLLVTAIALLLLVELRIPVDGLRPAVERHAQDATGLDVKVEGPLYLVTGRRPGAELHGLVVSGEIEQRSVEILRLGVARAEIEWWALLSREVRARELRAADVTLWFDAPALTVLARAERRESARASAATPFGWRFVDVARAEVTRARVVTRWRLLRQAGDVLVDSLTLHAQAKDPMRLEMRGSFLAAPARATLRIASLAELRGGATSTPIELQVALADASVQVSGVFDLDAQRGEYRVALKGHGRFLERLLPGFRAALGDVEDISIAGRLRTSPDEYAVEDLSLAAGRTQARGELRERRVNGRFRTEGQLAFETLDLRPWLPLFAAPERGTSGTQDALEAVRALQARTDLDLKLSAARLSWAQREADDAEIAVRLSETAAELDAHARLLAGAGTLAARLDTAGQEAGLQIEATADGIALAAVHPGIAEAGVGGLVQTAKLRASGHGASVAALVESLEGELELHGVEASWTPVKDAAATRFKIDRATLVATRDALQGSFAAAIDDAKIALKLSSARSAVKTGQREVDSAFELGITRSGVRGVRLAAAGELSLGPQGWAVGVTQASLGQSRGSLSAKGAWTSGEPLTLRAAFERFDVAALDFFDLESRQRRRARLRWEDRRVLPSEVSFPAADFEFSSKRLDAPALRFEAVRLAGRTRGGRLEAARYELRGEGGAMRGELSADLRGRDPQMTLALEATAFDLRSGLAQLGVDVERAKAQRLDATLELRGARLQQAVAQSTLRLSAQGLAVTARGPLDARRALAFDGRLEASSIKGELLATASGTLDRRSFRATSRGPKLATLLDGAERVPLDIELNVDDSAVSLRGDVAKGPRADLAVRVSAKRADTLFALGGLQFDAQGALSASAQLQLTPPARTALEQLELRIGETALRGRAVADWSAARPSVEARLVGPVLRMQDLGLRVLEDVEGAVKSEKTGAQQGVAARWLDSLRRYDATLDLQAERLYGAGEMLGSLQMSARLRGGRLQLRPLAIRYAASAFRAEGLIDATATTPAYALHAELRNFDLTPLLRSFKVSAAGTASFDARAVLRSRGVGREAISNLSGTLDVASYGRGIGSGVIELMGVSLFGTVLNTLDRERTSKINCAVGVFDVAGGVMKSRALFVDTTRLRIMGNLDVDLNTETLDGGLRPHPKNPRLFNVPTPVSIAGTLQDPKVSLASSTLPELLIRYSNPYTMFLGTLMETESAAEDGSDDCRAAYKRIESSRPEVEQEIRKLFKFLP
jgi:uncharacterized protein involved in outer membrane biogenesis